MDSWHSRANEVFAKALEFETSAEGSKFLDDACAGDDSLRAEVEALLAAHEEAGSFLEKPATAIDQTVDVNPRVMEAGLAATFTSDAAVVMGDAVHSVLKSIGKTLNRVPHVALRGEEDEQSPESASIQPGSGSRYQLEGEIARGGMGAILKGRDADLGRDLAIKVLLDSHKDDPDVVARFIEEAQIGGQLQHPGIVPVHELGQFDDQRPFFSMKLVKGETLASMLAKRTDPSDDRPKFLGIFEQICQCAAQAQLQDCYSRLDASEAENELVLLAKETLAAEPKERLRDAGMVAERTTQYLEGVQERLKAAELARAEAQMRAEEERRRRRLHYAIAGLVLLFAVGTTFAAVRFRDIAEDNRKQLYVSDMNVALQFWEQGNLGRVIRLLQRHILHRRQEDLRQFEWYYLWERCREPLSAVGVQHDDVCFSVAWSPDGERVATAGREYVRLWDTRTHKEIIRLQSPKYTWGVAFSRDGSRLAGANLGTKDTNGGFVNIWSMATMRLEHSFHVPNRGLLSIAFSDDGNLVTAGTDQGEVHVWDIDAGNKVHTLVASSRGVPAISFSSDGSYLVTGDKDGAAKLWQRPSMNELDHVMVDGEVVSIDISPKADIVAVRHGRKVATWDIETGTTHLLTEDAGTAGPSGVRFSPDGTTVVYDGVPMASKRLDAEGGRTSAPKRTQRNSIFEPRVGATPASKRYSLRALM